MRSVLLSFVRHWWSTGVAMVLTAAQVVLFEMSINGLRTSGDWTYWIDIVFAGACIAFSCFALVVIHREDRETNGIC